MRALFIPAVCLCLTGAAAQSQFPHRQDFDGVVAPALPDGWTTTSARSIPGDFTTTSSAPYSAPNAALSTNATIAQSITSPLLDFSKSVADSLIFHERRSASHNSGLIIEASTDGGLTFSIRLADTLQNPGTTSYVIRALKLPPDLDNQPGTRIRWRILGNGSGTTGTLRLDDITISARMEADAAAASILFVPQFLNAGDSAEMFITVKNNGTRTLQNIPLECFEDRNTDSIPDPDELFFSTIIGQSLQPGETVQTGVLIGTLSPGQHRFIARTMYDADQNRSNDILYVTLGVGLPRQSIVINEIMYAPRSGPEWIELFNTTTAPIDVKEWKLSNRNSIIRYLISSESVVFPSHGFLVVTKDSLEFRSLYPVMAGMLLQAPALPSFLLNNTGDAVVVFDNEGAVSDTVHYSPSWGGIDSASLERIEPTGPSNDPTNWGSSEDPRGSSPGEQNYLTPLEHNVRLVRVHAEGETVLFVVKNTGRQPASGYSISFYHDIDGDSIAGEGELVQMITVPNPLLPADSAVTAFVWDAAPAGEVPIIGVVHYDQDLRAHDDTVRGILDMAFPQNCIVVNEILYEPSSGHAEYVELYNRAPGPVNLQNWRISDVADTSTPSKTHIMSQYPLTLAAGEYLVLASDSSIFANFPYLSEAPYHVVVKRGLMSLNNEGDNVIVSDLTRKTIDSLRFAPSWHNADVEDVTGRSLERINPDLPGTGKLNWSTCADPAGGTPGKKNSLFTAVKPETAALSLTPNPFSPDGDGFEDVTIISYQLPSASGIIRVRVYDSNGRLVRTLADGEPTGSRGTIVWDGYSDRRERVRMGIYIVLLEGLDRDGGEVQRVKGVVVVAARM